MIPSKEKVLWDQHAHRIEGYYSERLRRIATLRGPADEATALMVRNGINLLSIAHAAFKGIPKDWKLEQPGEHVPAYFLRGPAGRSVAEELMGQGDRELAESRMFPVAPLCMLYRELCPKCHAPTDLPVFEELYRGESTWYVACESCGAQEVKLL